MGVSSVYSVFARSGAFELEQKNGAVRVRRIRKLPSRGFFRLAIPRAVATITEGGPAPEVKVRPDGIAWIVIVVMVGGLVVELFADRATHPRTYPPELVYVTAALYFSFLALEIRKTKELVLRTLAPRVP